MLDGPYRMTNYQQIETEDDACVWGAEDFRLHGKVTIVMRVCLPFSDPHPLKLCHIRHCGEKLLFVSYTSMKLEHTFVDV